MIKQLTTGFELIVGTENPHVGTDHNLDSPEKAFCLNRVADMFVIKYLKQKNEIKDSRT